MQTAMQKLIDYIEKNETIRNPDTDLLTPLSSVDIHRKAMELLEMEKEEMVNFGNDLIAQYDTNYIGIPNLAEQYYNETFKKD